MIRKRVRDAVRKTSEQGSIRLAGAREGENSGRNSVRYVSVLSGLYASNRMNGSDLSAVSLSGGGQDLLQCRPQLMQRKCFLNTGRGTLVQHLLLNLFCAESTKYYNR